MDIQGTSGDDQLQDTASSDTIFGLDGDDRLTSDKGGNDWLDGGAGNDHLLLWSWQGTSLLLDGGTGNDVIDANVWNNISFDVLGGDGDDRILISGSGAMRVDAGDGDDVVIVGSEGDMMGGPSGEIALGAGRDTLVLNASYGSMFTVFDFTAGADGAQLVFDGYLTNVTGWDQKSNPFAGGYLSLVQDGFDVIISLDLDGAGTKATLRPMVTLQSVTLADLTTYNLGGYQLDGAAPTDLVITGNGSGETLSGNGGDDVINGGEGRDILTGRAGDDRVAGGGGDDAIDGGLGSDILSGGDGDDRIVDNYGFHNELYGGDGNDELVGTNRVSYDFVQSSGYERYTMVLDGGDGDDRITASGAGYGEVYPNQVTRLSTFDIRGGAGNDTIALYSGFGTIDAGDGDDVIQLNYTASASTLANGALSVTLGGGMDTIKLPYVYAGIRAATITDFTVGRSGDRIDVGDMLPNFYGWNYETNLFAAGYLSLSEDGAGNTIVSVDMDGGATTNSPVAVFILENVRATALTAENFGGFGPAGDAPTALTLRGGTGEDRLTGGVGADLIRGLDGNDILAGGYGADQLEGGRGDDTIDGGEGIDTLLGGSGDDDLSDMSRGGDTLRGEDGNDRLTILHHGWSGGAIAATRPVVLDGGAGDDQIRFLLERPDGYTSLRSTITGGDGADLIEVGVAAGATIDAGDGDDIVSFPLIRGSAVASIRLGSGMDTLILNGVGAKTVIDFQAGEAGDRLDLAVLRATFGHYAIFKLAQFGSGVQLRVSRYAGDTETTVATFQNVKIADLSAYNLGGIVTGAFAPISMSATGTAAADELIGRDANDTLSGLAGEDVLRGAAGADLLDGGDGNDLLDGGSGDDVMTGGNGNDIYHVDAAGDVTIERAGGGTDTVIATVSHMLADEVEVLVLRGHGMHGTGNALDNRLEGTDGDDQLDGGLGSDRLIGGLGDDRYVVDAASDRVIEFADQGRDTVEAHLSWRLGANLERLVLLGAAAINGTGNTLDNDIVGNDAANILNGGGGADVLVGYGGDDRLNGGIGADRMEGGLGDDTYIVDNPDDIVVELVGEGYDTVMASIDYTLGDGLERLVLRGAARSGTGNALDNTIVGGNAGDVLHGLAGNDSLAGGLGADILDGGDGDDTLTGGAGRDELTGGAGADRFVFLAGDLGAERASADRITDFSQSDGDRINLRRIDAIASTETDDSFVFIGTRAFTGTAGELRQERVGTETFVMGDTTGDGIADVLIRLSGDIALTSGDFIL